MGDDWSRRSVLAAMGGVATVGSTALAPRVAAQITRQLVIPAAEEFAEDEGYLGYFVHVGDEAADDDVNPEDVDGCEFADWPPDGIQTYNGTLIDRIQEDHRQVPTQVFAATNADIETGSLWVVNRKMTCPDHYVGLEVEQVGAAFGNVSEDTGTPGTDANPIGQPGFGPVATVAGLVTGAAGLARWAQDDE